MAFNNVFSWIMRKRVHQIELFMKYPHEVQAEVFQRLTTQARHTVWGRKYGYSENLSSRQFAERVPLQTYESLHPYIERIVQGETNVLWPGETRWFAKSSGTTQGKSKFIPVTRETLEECHYKGGKDLLALYYHNNPEAKIFNGKSLVVGGSSTLNEFRPESYIGDLSAIIINNLPIWVELKRVPEKAVALMSDWEAKLELMARQTAHEDVTNMAGVPSWTLLLLKRVMEIRGKQFVDECWPNIELFMHGGVSFRPYRQQYESLFSRPIFYYENYNASEGFFGIQDRNHAEDMLLMLDYGIYYEFIPPEEWDSAQPRAIGLEDVQAGIPYALVISTNSGLWRYQPGDTVVFTSLNPFRIKVAGRTKHFINAFGEELIIENAESALAEVCRKLNCIVTDFTAGPIFMESNKKGGHEWLIEFDREPGNLGEFTRELDAALQRVNSDYEAKRTASLALDLPVVHNLPQGTFYNWLKKNNKLGGQHKVPRLMNNRDLLEQLLEFSGIISA